ncbi:hypothetical protein ABMA58_18630, partial [Oceanospirillum sp. HFRX-1_2]
PVAEVSRVVHEPGKPFASVSARPLAQLERSRYVLMLNPRDVTGEVVSEGGNTASDNGNSEVQN